MPEPQLVLHSNDRQHATVLRANPNVDTSIVYELPSEDGSLVTKEEVIARVILESSDKAGTLINVTTPVILTPLNDDPSFNGDITSSIYSATSVYLGKHVATDWEIAYDDQFTSLADSSYNDTINLTSYSYSPKLHNTEHYIRCRYKTNKLVSEWSDPVRVLSKDSYIVNPVLTLSTVDPIKTELQPSLTSSGFTVINGTDTHEATEYQIATVSNFRTLVYSNSNDRVNLTSLTCPAKLEPNTTYFTRARYKGVNNVSSWSNVITFKTTTVTEKPILSGFYAANENSVATVYIENYSSNNLYEATSLYGTAKVFNNIVHVTLPSILATVTNRVSVTARDTTNLLAKSEAATYEFTINNLNTVTDQSLVYNTSNIIGNFFKTTGISNGINMSGTIQYTGVTTIMGYSKPSVVNKLYIDNTIADVNVGDILTTDMGETITVKTVNDDGTTAIYDNDNNVGAGFRHSAYINVNKQLCVVGDNAYGQLGLLNTTGKTGYTNTSIIAKSVVCGSYFTAIIKDDDSVWVSGYNIYGQLGINSTLDSLTFVNTGHFAKKVICGSDAIYLIKEDDYVWAAGRNTEGQLGLGTNTNMLVFTNTNIRASMVSAGASHAAIVDLTGKLFITGLNSFGQLGLGNNTNVNVFTDTGIYVKSVSCGSYITGIIKIDDTVWTCGANTVGQLGINTLVDSNVFVNTGFKAKKISCRQHTVIIDLNRKVYACGYNGDGRLGNGTTTNSSIFVNNNVFADFIIAGDGFTMLYSYISNVILATGRNDYGQLGQGDTTNRYTFISTGCTPKLATNIEYHPNYWIEPVTALTYVPTNIFSTKCKASTNYIVQDTTDKDFKRLSNIVYKETVKDILDKSHTSTVDKIYVNNKLLDLQPGQTLVSNTGELFTVSTVNDDGVIADMSDIKKIVTGVAQAVLLKNNGEVWTTGYNSNGELGLGHNSNIYAFTNTGQLAIDVACTYYSTYIVKADGSVWSTGRNNEGQLGLGNATSRNVFTNTGVIATAIYAFGYNAFITKSDGYLYGAGFNGYGQLGLGDNVNRNIFTNTNIKVSNLWGGDGHIFALKTDGTYVCAGRNTYGQLCLGNTNGSNTWVPLGFTPKKIATGDTYTVILKIDNTVWCCGNNRNGRLGLNDTTDRTALTNTGHTGIDVVALLGSAGIIKADGSLWVTGYNSSGILGLGDNTDRLVFTKTLDNFDKLYVTGGYRMLATRIVNGITKILGTYLQNVGLPGNTGNYKWSTLPTIKGFIGDYKPNYYIVPTSPLATIPTALYPVSEVTFNDQKAIPAAATISGTTLTISANAVELTPTRKIKTLVELPVSNILTSITADIYKITD